MHYIFLDGVYMKLLVTLNFDEEGQSILYQHMLNFFEKCESGIFTKRENIHITLAYIDESTNVGSVVKIIEDMDESQFDIKLSDSGEFRRSGSDIYWIGIEKSNELARLQKVICRKLSGEGVMTDNDSKLHLTVSRDTVVDKDAIPKASFDRKIPVKRISLMKYECTRSGSVYTEVYAKELRA